MTLNQEGLEVSTRKVFKLGALLVSCAHVAVEAFWGDALQLHEAIGGGKHIGIQCLD